MNGIDLFQALDEIDERFIHEASRKNQERRRAGMMWKMTGIGAAAFFAAAGMGILMQRGGTEGPEVPQTVEIETESTGESETKETESIGESKTKETEGIGEAQTNETEGCGWNEAGKMVTAVLKDGIRYRLDTTQDETGNVQAEHSGQIRMMNPETQTYEILAESAASNLSPYLASDGSKLYYASASDGMFRMYVQELESRTEADAAELIAEIQMEAPGEFGEEPVYRIEGVCGDYLIYSGGLSFDRQVYAYDMNGRESIKLGNENMAVTDCFFETPYLVLHGISTDVSPNALMYASVDGQKQVMLTDSSMSYAIDGNLIYYTDGGRWNMEEGRMESFELVTYDIISEKEIAREALDTTYIFGILFFDSRYPVGISIQDDGTCLVRDVKKQKEMVVEYNDRIDQVTAGRIAVCEDTCYVIYKNQYAEIDFENHCISEFQNYTEEEIANVTEVRMEKDAMLVFWNELDGTRHLTEVQNFLLS